MAAQLACKLRQLGHAAFAAKQDVGYGIGDVRGSLFAAASRSSARCLCAVMHSALARVVSPGSCNARTCSKAWQALAADSNSRCVAAASSACSCGCTGLSHTAARHSLYDAVAGASCNHAAKMNRQHQSLAVCTSKCAGVMMRAHVLEAANVALDKPSLTREKRTKAMSA